jgi:hypothetical protein
MYDRDVVVRIDVKHEVLIGTSHASSKAAVSAFQTNRGMIERLASAKYDSHDFVTYANGAVVSIVAQDWDPVTTGNGFEATPKKMVVPELQPLPKNPSPLIEKLQSAGVAAS